MLSPALIEQLAAAYRLRDARLLGSLRANKVFSLASARGPLVVRQLRTSGVCARLREQHAFMAYLAGRGVPVPMPLVTTRGDTVACLNGVAYVVLPLIAGGWLRPGNARHMAAAARNLARHHAAAVGYAGPLERTSEPDFRRQFLKAARRWPKVAAQLTSRFSAPRIVGTVRDLAAAVEPLRLRVRRLPYAELPTTVIHGDYRQSNLIFRGGRLVAVLDFDRSRHETAGLDLAIALWTLARGARGTSPVDAALVRLFMASYGQIRPLQDQERRALPTLIEAKVALTALRRAARLLEAAREKQAKRAGKLVEQVRRLRSLQRASIRWEAAVRER